MAPRRSVCQEADPPCHAQSLSLLESYGHTAQHSGHTARALPEPRPHARCQPPQRWVGLGVIADNLINVGLAIGKQSAK